ncbi:hypothetical protein V8C86DRAFT_2591395 [Haematococcus lacustris]
MAKLRCPSLAMQHCAVFAACIITRATSINQNPAIPSRHLPTPAPAVPSPKPSYEIADSPEVLAQLFGRNDAAFKPAPVPADTLFPIQPEMCSQAQATNPKAFHYHLVLTTCDRRPHWATVLATTMLSISDSYALPTTTSIVWCHYQPDSPSSLPSLLRNFRHNRRTNVFFIPKTMPVNTNSVYYAALTVPSAMGCPEMPLVVVEDDVAFASNFYNHLSNLHKSALALAGSNPFMLTLYRPSPVNNTVNVMKRVRDIQNRSGLLEDSWQTPHKEIPLASLYEGPLPWPYGVQGMLYSPRMVQGQMLHFHQVQTGQRVVPGFQDMIVMNLVRYRVNCFASTPMLGNETKPSCHVLSANVSIVQHTGGASAVFNDKDGKSTRFHMAEDFSVALGLASEDPEGTW